MLFMVILMFITLPMEAVAKYCDERFCVCVCLCVCVCVCVSVCLSICEDISGTILMIFTKFFVHLAYGCGSVLL